MKKILVPTDFSFLANCSVNFATQLARLDPATIKLIHVIEPPLAKMNSTGEIMKDPMSDVYVLELVKKSERQLQEILERYADRNISMKYEIVIGNPALSILDEVQADAIDLIIMGAKGSTWIDRLLIGSTTEKVVKNATCPVITLKCNIEKIDKLGYLVYAFNPDDDQRGVFEEINIFANTVGAHLYLLIVVTPSRFKSTHRIRQQMDEFVKIHKPLNYSTHIYTDVNEEEGIMHFAEEVNAGLIAIGINAHTNIFGLLTTNFREDIVNHSQRPVWTYNYNINKHSTTDETSENFTCSL
jgi:nucleotide-binding universal stress UspA family protein